MNEQEKALQGMIEFCKWLIPNAKQLGLEQSKSIAMISQAQTPDDIVNGMNSLYQELGEEQFTALTQAFQKSKTSQVKKAKYGTKMDYLVNKLSAGNQIPEDPKQRQKDENNIYLIERMVKTAKTPSTVEDHPWISGIRDARSEDDRYQLNAKGADSLLWWDTGINNVVLSNSGPNKTWVGYSNIRGEDGNPETYQLSDAMRERVQKYIFNKLHLK